MQKERYTLSCSNVYILSLVVNQLDIFIELITVVVSYNLNVHTW